jgi:hypothetical protein
MSCGRGNMGRGGTEEQQLSKDKEASLIAHIKVEILK